ncbi:MAG TPA: 4-(cytidine 5'-diphospho)-2-C-methyl-D-erythritol kinase [Actinomycetota bacterium]|nr:4-(cytidine 5'-diphospho)-2-C-methyl-D-erythritol kinase [Actinomycetota bacterium]
MTDPANTVRVAAPAKINVFLRVVGRRGDGFHDLQSVVLPISLTDQLEIHAVGDPTQFRTLSLSLEMSGDVVGVPADESNLVIRAAKALADRAGIRGFAEIALDKRIPAAAGLGGGSSDAAATLVALNEVWDAGLSPSELGDVAAEVGSDVPALLRPAPRLIEGRGERTSDVEAASLRWAVVTFDFGVSTADAFGWWDEDGKPTGPAIEERLPALRGDATSLGGHLFNDLEDPVVGRHPAIGEVKRVLTDAGIPNVMSGSGPTVVGLVRDDQALDAQAESDLRRMAGRAVGMVTSMGSRPSA